MTSWLRQHYKIGQIIKAPHPANNEMRDAKITNFTVDKSANSFSNNPNGIMVQFEDGVFMEIPMGLLNEDGSGM